MQLFLPLVLVLAARGGQRGVVGDGVGGRGGRGARAAHAQLHAQRAAARRAAPPSRQHLQRDVPAP